MVYRIECAHCGEKYETSRAGWCRCLNKDRSLICPSCRRCFCDANADYVTSFWKDAPPELWAMRRELRVTDEPLAPILRKPLVLVVDDDAGIRHLAMELITRFGYGCLVASNADTALRLAQRYHPDLVLTDLLMPGVDGRELASALKSDSQIPTPKVAVMTSVYRGHQYEGEAREVYGVDAYFEKPVPLEELRTELAELLPPAEKSQARLDPSSDELTLEDLEGYEDLDDENLLILG